MTLFKEKYRLIITVKEIKGNCPVFEVGDKIVVESPKIVVEGNRQHMHPCLWLHAINACPIKPRNKLQKPRLGKRGR